MAVNLYYFDPLQVINSIYDFFEFEFKSAFETPLTRFLGDNYRDFYRFEIEPIAIVNILKVNLLYFILKNDEEKYMVYMEVF